MSNRKGKIIVDESDEEVEDSYPNLFRPNDPLCSSRSNPWETVVDQRRALVRIIVLRGLGFLRKVGDGEESSSEPSRPSKKRNLGHRREADAYPIDYITCATFHTDLLKLRNLYNIPEEVLLVIPGKGDVPSRPPRGCGLGEPSLVEVKHLYQLRSSPREASWYYFMSSFVKRNLSPTFLPHVKTGRTNSSLLGEIESWGLIKKLDDKLLLMVETALVNESTCKNLLLVTNLVGSRLVDVAVGMDNKILSAMSKKRARGSSGSSNPPPLKKINVGSSKASAPTLPPPPPRTNGGEKVSDKSPEVSVQSRDRSSPLPPRDQGDHLTSYHRDSGKLMGPKMVKDIKSINLSELAGSVQRVSFKLATLVSCYKNKSTRHERRLQADN
ncbi:uncharacterized protein LOC107176553 [Citrus sinensis]|uniref:uncharacterized protein LOC107176553 n=1 Tax=Citrus sinensis TaxID=2711 RepID=UPI0007638FDC|nr:uncharacterized protein LOC107176553 [Citrus sinensis]XP_024033587.1 uncharacterized protein LOC112095712 [Citrus x clementina]